MAHCDNVCNRRWIRSNHWMLMHANTMCHIESITVLLRTNSWDRWCTGAWMHPRIIGWFNPPSQTLSTECQAQRQWLPFLQSLEIEPIIYINSEEDLCVLPMVMSAARSCTNVRAVTRSGLEEANGSDPLAVLKIHGNSWRDPIHIDGNFTLKGVFEL